MSAAAQPAFRRWTRGGPLGEAYAGELDTLTHPSGAIEWNTSWGEAGTAYRFSGRSVTGAGLMIGASYTGSGVLTSRDRATVRRAESEWVIGYIPLAGSVNVARSRDAVALRPGQFGVVPSPDPVDVRISRRARTLTLFFPRDLVHGLGLAKAVPVARALPGNPAFRLLLQHLTLTMRMGSSLDAIASYAATRAAAELLAAALSSARPESAPSHDAVRIAQLRHYIDTSLGTPDLSVAQVAAANFISPRTMQRLFSASGETASAYIRRRRLEMCRSDILARPELPIAKICQRWGLPDTSHLARQFRAQFGATAQEVRAQAARTSPASVLSQ
jgi:AraC-like DNA-binding protein